MPSELKRGAIRLLSNYARLGLFLVLGILFVPIFMLGTGDAGLGLLGLLGSGIGIAEMCNEIARQSMNRELGAAYHSDEKNEFRETFNAAIVLTAGLALITALLFVILALCLPFFRIPDELRPAAMWLLVCKGIYSVISVLFGPQFNMYLVTERMVLYNTWSVIKRASEFAAALILFVLLGLRDPELGIKAFAVLSAGGMILTHLTAVALITMKDRRLIPQPSCIRIARIRSVLSTAGWNSASVTAMNMHIRLDNLIMNSFGIIYNTGFTLATRLAGYIRVIAFASTQGLDVVSARLEKEGGGQRVEAMMHHSTRIHAMVALPAGAIVLFLADPLMTLWVGRTTENPETLATAIVLAQVLVVGMTARGISDCWTRTLYGAGHIRAYAPLVLVGGALNPVIAIGLIAVLPSDTKYLGPAIAFSSIFVVLHFLIIPFIAARCLNVGVKRILAPVFRPAVVTLLVSAILLLPHTEPGRGSIIVLLLSIALFVIALLPISWFWVLPPADRHQIRQAILRRLKRAPARTPGDAGVSEDSLDESFPPGQKAGR